MDKGVGWSFGHWDVDRCRATSNVTSDSAMFSSTESYGLAHDVKQTFRLISRSFRFAHKKSTSLELLRTSTSALSLLVCVRVRLKC